MSADPHTPLRAAREAAGLSRDDLASKAKVSGEYIRRLEAGQHTPTLELARRLAGALGTTVDELWPPALPAAANE